MNEAVEGNENYEDKHNPLRGANQLKPEEDCSDAENLSRVANEPVEPVEDGPVLVSGGTAAECHEGLYEAEA